MRLRHDAHNQVLGDYELVRLLATGGMAEVYEARRVGAHGFAKRFALKRILPQLARDERLVQMFCDEAKIHATLSHPNLVEVVDFGDEDGELYMVMEFVDGMSCAELLSAISARRRTVELGVALHVARELLHGLAYAHDARDEHARPLGLIHRDVAPSNILIGKTGQVKLADFGIMRSCLIQSRTAPGEVKGKIGYVSPEQAVGAALDARSDQFSLGVVIAEMLLARPLFPGRTELEILSSLHAGDLSVLRAYGRHVPADVSAILLRAMSKNPAQRYPTARAFGADVDGAIRRHGVGLGAHGLSEWLADLGLIALDSRIQEKDPSSLDRAFREEVTLKPAVDSKREVARVELRRLSVRAQRIVEVDLTAVSGYADGASDEAPTGALAQPAGEYRIRRSGGTVVGPFALPRVLELVATGALGPDTLVSCGGGRFVPIGSLSELARLAQRPPFRFFDFVGLRASERHVIARASLAQHLFEIVLERRTGLLCARSGSQQARAYFVDGNPMVLTSTHAQDLLGKRLVATGLVEASKLERALELGWQNGRRLGEALEAAGLLPRGALFPLLAAQRMARLTTLCRFSEGELLFVDGERSQEESVQPLGDPLKLVARAVRDGYDDHEIAQLLSGALDSVIVRTPHAAERAAGLDLPPQESYAFARCGAGTLATLVETLRTEGTAEERATLRAVFLGLSCGALAAIARA